MSLGVSILDCTILSGCIICFLFSGVSLPFLHYRYQGVYIPGALVLSPHLALVLLAFTRRLDVQGEIFWAGGKRDGVSGTLMRNDGMDMVE